jgi:large subunit ribosomal protein L9
MEVILLERIQKLGNISDIVKVKDGFARNFLIPQGKAMRATEANKAQIEEKRKQLMADDMQKKEEAGNLLSKLPSHIIIIRQAGEDGRLFGAVTTKDIAAAVSAISECAIEKSQIILPSVIKSIDVYSVEISLHADVNASLKVVVSRTEDEAKTAIANINKKEIPKSEEVISEDSFDIKESQE